jgi:hypothetical protein
LYLCRRKPNDSRSELSQTGNSTAINLGDEVVVSFDINAREYNGRWYNDIRAWRVSHDVSGGAAPVGQDYVQAPPTGAPAPDDFAPSSEKDDLPF